MRIYKITTDCLVDFCMLTWYIVARNEREAWLKGWMIVRNCNVADEGAMACERVKEIPANVQITREVVKC